MLENQAMTLFSLVDAFGFIASIMTLVAFAQRSMLPMRVAAIAANIFFIAYGALGPYYPVLSLHLVLLPLNLRRFVEQAGASKTTLIDLWRQASEESTKVEGALHPVSQEPERI
jgi:hypothetical protein